MTFPTDGNIQVLLWAHYGRDPWPFQVEEIVLRHDDCRQIADYLLSLDNIRHVSVNTTEESGSSAGVCKMVATVEFQSLPVPSAGQSPLADEIVRSWRDHLADEATVLFSPIHEMWMFRVEGRSLSNPTVIESTIDPANRTSGHATVSTSDGDIYVEKDRAYTRVGWL
jgi:hypothetical protein